MHSSGIDRSMKMHVEERTILFSCKYTPGYDAVKLEQTLKIQPFFSGYWPNIQTLSVVYFDLL